MRGGVQSNVTFLLSITVVSGMGCWWRSCSWLAFANNWLFEASGFADVAAHVLALWVTWKDAGSPVLSLPQC